MVKSKKEMWYVADLEEAFSIFRKYNMRLNQTKCAFWGESKEVPRIHVHLDVHLERHRCQPKEYSSKLWHATPKVSQGCTKISGTCGTLHIQNNEKKCRPFFRVMKNTKKSEWDEEYPNSFKHLKKYLMTSGKPKICRRVILAPLYVLDSRRSCPGAWRR